MPKLVMLEANSNESRDYVPEINKCRSSVGMDLLDKTCKCLKRDMSTGSTVHKSHRKFDSHAFEFAVFAPIFPFLSNKNNMTPDEIMKILGKLSEEEALDSDESEED
ncbi:hypothetical protein C0J52_25910 [Blattella germanica]|nr:hypothetical protein C0J52_25910 [Blattella germanica]